MRLYKVQNSGVILRSQRFFILTLDVPRFSNFGQSARVCTRERFSSGDQHALLFSLWANYFLAIFSKYTSLEKTSFSARDKRVLSFLHWAHHFLASFIKVHDFVQNSVSGASSARFVIFAQGTTLFSCFEQSGRVCTKQSFRQKVSTFCWFRSGRNTFCHFQESARVGEKLRLQLKTSTCRHFCTGFTSF